VAEFDIHPRGNRPHGAKAKQQPTPPYTHTLNRLCRVSIWNFPLGACKHQNNKHTQSTPSANFFLFPFRLRFVRNNIFFAPHACMFVEKRGKLDRRCNNGRLYIIFFAILYSQHPLKTITLLSGETHGQTMERLTLCN